VGIADLSIESIEVCMKSAVLTLGRTFSVTFEHGKDFFSELKEFCTVNSVKQGYIPFFIAGMSEVELVGTCQKVEDKNAPIRSKVYLETVEAVGAGTLAFDEETGQISPHIHVSIGQKTDSAIARMSHLLNAKVLFLTEMVVVEVIKPHFRRMKNPSLHNIELLSFLNDEELPKE
jgi:predicted DNA-binding protein with PD1-like motif